MLRLLTLLVLTILCWSSVPSAQTPRVIYLATTQGDGSDDNSFRSTGHGTVANQGCINLRPDPTVSTGRYLCAADTLPVGAGITQLAATLGDNITAPRKAALEAVLGVTITSSNIIDIIAELLTTHARQDGTRWKPLRAGRDGKYKIWLGGGEETWKQTAWLWDEWHIKDNGLVADATNYTLGVIEPTLAWAASIAEDFNCANNASLTCDLTWTEFFGTDWAIDTNAAKVTGLTGTQQKEARADSSLSTATHWAQVTLGTVTADNGGITRCGPMASKSNDGTRTFYSYVASNSNNTFTDTETRARVAGTLSTLATDTTDPAVGEVLRIYKDGSSISGYVNGVLRVGPTTDTTVADETYTGIVYSSNNPTTQSCILDDFSAQDISTPFGVLRRRAS